MSILDLTSMNENDIVEPTVAEEGEHELRIVDIKMADNKNGYPYMLPRFEIPSLPTSKEFTKYIALPHADMDAKEANKTKLKLKYFSDAFNLDLFGRQTAIEEMVGSMGWAILGIETDEEYGDSNYVKQFVSGH